MTVKELFILCCIFIGLVSVGIVYSEKCNCERTAQITEKEYKFDWIAGCFYKENNKWVKYNRYNK